MKKIIVFGGSGLVGSRFISLQKENFEITAPSASEVDILDLAKVKEFIGNSKADLVVNFAAYTQVEKAEEEKGKTDGLVYKINALGAKQVADTCQALGEYLVHISTDYVFDGGKFDSPYTEEDEPNPKNWYGATKLFGEEFVLTSGCKGAIVRISMPFSPFYKEKPDIARFFLQELKTDRKIWAVEDQRITPTLVDDIVAALKIIIDNGSLGLYHVSSRDSVSPLEFAKTIAELFNLRYDLISSINFEDYNKKKRAKLLKYSWLNPAKFEKEFGDGILHTVEEGLVIFKEAVDSGKSN